MCLSYHDGAPQRVTILRQSSWFGLRSCEEFAGGALSAILLLICLMLDRQTDRQSCFSQCGANLMSSRPVCCREQEAEQEKGAEK